MTLRRWPLTALLAVLACGCAYDDVYTPPPTPEVSVTAGGYTVRVDPDHLDVALLRGDTVLLDFPADGLELGTVPALGDMVNYDPTPLVIPSVLDPPPDGLAWIQPAKMAVTASGATGVTLSLSYPGGKGATLQIDAPADGSFRAKLTPDATGAPVAYFRLRPRTDAHEGFYGLGEYYDSVNQRGKVRAMQLEIDPNNESGYNEVHVPIPFVIGTRGWGLFVESPYPGVFDVAAQKDDLLEAYFGTGSASTDGLTFHLFGEERPLDVTRHYYDVTGYPLLPARWALGPWVWRDEDKDQAQAESDLETMRDQDLPDTAYWLDRPYQTAVGVFDFEPSKYQDPQALIAKAHDLGFRLALWHAPYLDKNAPETAALRAEAVANGYYPEVTGVPLNGWGTLIDFTNPAAFAWWQDHLTYYTDLGVEGFKLDYGEDVVPGLTAGRNVWEFADGSDERTMHSRYQLFYHRVYGELLPSTGGFLLCRHGTYGDQVNVSVIWPGDLDSSFARSGDTVQQGTSSYVAVGGLPGSLIAGLSLGPSGYPFFGADTGGYLHSPPDKELFSRWFEQTSLSTVMQMGNAGSTVAWEADPTTGYDAEMLGWYRTYTRLHLRLFPYEWTYAQNLAKDGRPITRPLGLAYPEIGQHPDDTYMFGDSLLVAPVVDRGVTQRSVILPKGRWIDWWTGQGVDGGVTIMADAPLGTLPLYLAEGSIIPMLRPTIDTTAPTTTPGVMAGQVDSYATTPGVLYARVVAGAASSFTVFDGAVLAQDGSSGTVKLTSKDGSEFHQGTVFELIAAGSTPSQVTDNGATMAEVATLDALEAAASGWVFTADTGGTVFVKVAAGAHAVEVTP